MNNISKRYVIILVIKKELCRKETLGLSPSLHLHLIVTIFCFYEGKHSRERNKKVVAAWFSAWNLGGILHIRGPQGSSK